MSGIILSIGYIKTSIRHRSSLVFARIVPVTSGCKIGDSERILEVSSEARLLALKVRPDWTFPHCSYHSSHGLSSLWHQTAHRSANWVFRSQPWYLPNYDNEAEVVSLKRKWQKMLHKEMKSSQTRLLIVNFPVVFSLYYKLSCHLWVQSECLWWRRKWRSLYVYWHTSICGIVQFEALSLESFVEFYLSLSTGLALYYHILIDLTLCWSFWPIRNPFSWGLIL